MAEARITPEKELLNLIEGSKGDDKAQVEKQAFKRKVNSFFSFGAIIGRLSFLKDRFQGGAKGGKFYLDIKAINKALAVCVFFLAAYFTVSFLATIMNSKKISSMDLSVNKESMPYNLPEVASLKPVSYYLEKAKARNVFSMMTDTSAKENEAKALRARVMELAKNLKLVGISWSDDPDIIIEDTKEKQAFFLKKGQKVSEFTIKSVYKDRVILSYGQEEVELR